jgi:NDP-4-keto-2,6-dideoxyhexose 3-C-methyltransferase
MTANLRYHSSCRICGNDYLEAIVDLQNQPISSVFPFPGETDPTSTPLQLVRCSSSVTKKGCGLLQLRHTASLEEMYGTTYGYYSSLSTSMVQHLECKVKGMLETFDVPYEANILDIGCNDGTLLNSYITVAQRPDLRLYGIDPSSEKFRASFDSSIQLDIAFFDSSYEDKHPEVLFHLITSIAMFYDIDDPLKFVSTISSILHPNGVWAFELSYLPLFLQQLSYDQICHEHVTYYSLTDLVSLLKSSNLGIFKVELNDMNGGSIYIMSCHESRLKEYANDVDSSFINDLLLQEKALQLPSTYINFRWRLDNHRDEVRQFFDYCKRSSSSVLGYGASTKGNILANYCGITSTDLPMIGDLNPEKHGRITPGTHIPIQSHDFVKSHRPNYLFVFIWHFRNEVIELEMEYLENGGCLVFPLPRLYIVDKHNVHLFKAQPLSLQAFAL